MLQEKIINKAESAFITEMKVAPNKADKLLYLEGIRGLAAFMVMIYHYSRGFYPTFATGNPETSHLGEFGLLYYANPVNVITNGNFYVTIFFVLSGYVLSKSYFEKRDFDILISASFRRFPRLFIPAAVSIIISFLLVRLSLVYHMEASKITLSEWLAVLWRADGSFSSLIRDFISAIFSQRSAYNISLWTISVELFGSFLVFAILALTHKTRNLHLVLILLLAVCCATSEYYYSAFILGILLNYSNIYTFKNALIRQVLICIFLLAGLFLGAFPSHGSVEGTFFEFADYNMFISRDSLIHVIGAFFFVLAVNMSKRLQHFFSLKLFNFLGYISFSLYLLHALVLGSFTCYLFLQLQQIYSYNMAVLLAFIPSVALLIAVSYFMTNYVDKGSVRISKFIYNKWFASNPAVNA